MRAAPPGGYCDGQGLHLLVKPTGTRSWIQQLATHGRRCDLGFGTVQLVSLAEAQEEAVAINGGEAESNDENEDETSGGAARRKPSKKDRAELPRRTVDTIGRRGQPCAQIQKVISVGMLSEG